MSDIKKIVVAYSGGLDTSVLLQWLKETYGAEVVAYCADVGQGNELDGLEEKALSTGASSCHIDDLREEFARDFIYPMIQAGATECSACKMQMEQGTTKPTIHPLKIMALAYGIMPELETLFTRRSEELIVT